MATATVDHITVGSTTYATLTFDVPDEDWVTIDVRIRAAMGAGSTTYADDRITCNITDTTEISSYCYTGTYKIVYDNVNKQIVVTMRNLNASDIKRVDYILSKGALTEAAQEQADIDFFDAMDANGDGLVDARDASISLSYYADASTGVIPPEYTGQAAWRYWANLKNTEAGSQIINPDAFPDFNEDGKVNAIDSSAILSYYAWAATTDTTGMTGPQAMREYRTQREAGLTD